MIAQVRDWYAGRTRREQLLLLVMVAIALPTLAWLLVVLPLGRAYDSALEEQLEAVDRHGRVLALVDAGKTRRVPVARADSGADLQLVVTESASQAGLALQGANPVGGNAIDVTIAGTSAPAIGQWLRGLESRGIRVEEMRMTPQGDALVGLSARLARRG